MAKHFQELGRFSNYLDVEQKVSRSNDRHITMKTKSSDPWIDPCVETLSISVFLCTSVESGSFQLYVRCIKTGHIT